MSERITVNKTSPDTFEVTFDRPVTFPGSDSGSVPVEWLRGVLDYHIAVKGSGSDSSGSDIHPDW